MYSYKFNKRRRYHSFQVSYQLISPWSHVCIYCKISLLFDGIIYNHLIFLYGTDIISQDHLKRSSLSRVLCLLYKTNCSHPLHQVDCGYLKNILRALSVFQESNCSSTFLKCLYIPQK